MVARTCETHGTSTPQQQSHGHSTSRPVNKPQWHKPNESDARLTHYPSQGFSTEEDGEFLIVRFRVCSMQKWSVLSQMQRQLCKCILP